MISSVLNLWVCSGLFWSVTVFVWMRSFLDPFDFRCLRDVPFRKRLFRSSFQEWVNPGGSSGQWLAPFWIFYYALYFFVWNGLYLNEPIFRPIRSCQLIDVTFRRSPSKSLLIFVFFLMSQVLCVTVFVPKLVFRPICSCLRTWCSVEKGCSEAPSSNGWTLLARAVND